MENKYKNKAIELMKHNKVDKLYYASDGNFFIDENSANNHALREHGAKRKKALKVEIVKLSDLTEVDEPDNSEPTKEELQAKYDELFEKYEKAEKLKIEKTEALKLAEQELEKAKGTESEAENIELVKKANTAFKTAETKANNLASALEDVETTIENFED